MADEALIDKDIPPSEEDESEDSDPDTTIDPADRDELKQVLAWIGYDTDAEIDALADELGSLKDFIDYGYKDIAAMVKDGVTYKSNTRTLKLKFPMSIQLALKKTLDWAQDRTKMGELATLEAPAFLAKLPFTPLSTWHENAKTFATKRRKGTMRKSNLHPLVNSKTGDVGCMDDRVTNRPHPHEGRY